MEETLKYKKNSSQIIYAEVLSPLHIGGSSEKHAQRNLDYLQKGNHFRWIDQNKLMLELQKKGKLNDFSYDIAEFGKIDITKYGIKEDDIVKNQQPLIVKFASDSLLRTFIANGMGNKIVPGSSIKGAIRSVLFNQFHKIKKEIYEEELFGKIDNNLMRYLQIADVNLNSESLSIYLSKVMSRSDAPSNAIKWKHQKEGSKFDFDDKTFTTNYECIKPNEIFEFKLLIADELWNFVKQNSRKLPPNSDKLFTKTPIIDLLKNIDTHTKKHIKKEIDFFKHKETKESKMVVSFFENLLIEKENTFLFRMASGSGFHGITGDWKFEEHIGTLTTGKDKDKKNLRYKTRRIALVENQLLPMGFVRLHLEKPKVEEYVERIFIESAKIIEEPTYFKGAIKPSAIEICAELIAVDKFSAKKTFKLWIDEKGKEQIVSLNYNAPLEAGTMHKVSINSVQKGKNGTQIQSITYKRPL